MTRDHKAIVKQQYLGIRGMALYLVQLPLWLSIPINLIFFKPLNILSAGVASALLCYAAYLTQRHYRSRRDNYVKTGQDHADEDNRLYALGFTALAAAVLAFTARPQPLFGLINALIAAGVARVVVACRDPNPLVAGQGIARLQAAGIAVTEGVCEEEAQRLNRGFFRRITTGRPFVTLKLAASLDGKTALANGESQWLTGEAARADVHYHRLAADAIIAGTGSILHDNAHLTARYPTELPSQPPLRVIIDSRLRTPRDAALFDDLSPILIACGMNARAPNYPAHAEWLRLPLKNGRVPLPALLDELGARGINNAFVEAGASLAGAFIQQNLADEILLYLAPCLLGSGARELLQLPPLQHLSDKMRVHIDDSTRIGADLRLRLTPEKPCSQAS